MKRFSKLLSLILVLSLLLPGMVFADDTNERMNVDLEKNKTTRELTEEEQVAIDEVRKIIQDMIKENGEVRKLEEDFNEDEDVRIIVELEEKPVIIYATESGQKYEDMSYSQRASIESQIYAAQEAVRTQIAARNIEMIYSRSFNTIFSGFSGDVRFADIEAIENIPGVKKVYIANEYERPKEKPDMGSSHEMIGSKEVWGEDIGYKGEGMVIAIIDTGVDPYHKDFKLSDETNTKIKENELPEGLKGKFFTDKVPYGYNYYDQNHEILDLGPGASEHGMHVAGTAAANGEIKGVAPEAQVLAMKVFGNDPTDSSTYDDIYLEAMEEAIMLGADVLNMSLGSSAAFYIEDSAIDIAITNAVENGIVCAISAGNSGYTYYGWEQINGHGLPFKEDPDYGVVGSPGLSKDSLQVASVENLKTTGPYLEYVIPSVEGVLPNGTVIIYNEAFDIEMVTIDGYPRDQLMDAIINRDPVYFKITADYFIDINAEEVELVVLPSVVTYIDRDGNESLCSVLPDGATGPGKEVKAPMTIASAISPREVFGDNPVEYVDCGVGATEDFEGKDLEGKIALIIRGGGPDFYTKILNAQNAGAATVIVYNHEEGGEELVNMAYPSEGTIPAVFIGHSYGKELSETRNTSITFPDGVILSPNPIGGEMSDFTSWGTTPTLELKPEITAPGGMIYSTLQNNKYGTMSGTSMAAPHVAGGAALVQQYLDNDEDYKNLPPREQTRLAKVLLMNTAEIIIDEDSEEKTPYSPRRQGAGLMKLNAAVTTPVYVVSDTTNEAKVELKDFNSKSITMNLKAINDSDKELTYNVDVDVLADFIYPELEINLLESRNVDADVTITNDGKITVPANGEKEFTVTIDFSEDEDIYENMFIEGFVKLTDESNEHPVLSIPYVGFYGDWDAPRILDAMEHEVDEDTRSYYEYSFVMSQGQIIGNTIPYEDKIAISPGTEDGIAYGNDAIVPVLSFLRNAEKVEYNILDEDGNKIRTIRNENYVRKNLFDGGRRLPYSLISARKWDGKVRGKIVDDGLYYYQIRTKIHDGEWQEKNIPIYVDTVAPEVTDLVYDTETGMLSWTATDEGTGVLQFLVFVDGDYVTDGYLKPEDAKVEGEENRYQYNIKEFIQDLPQDQENLIEVGVLDHAWNTGFGITAIGQDDEDPYIYLQTPELFSIYNDPNVRFSGYIYQENKIIQSIKINGEEVDFSYSNRLPVYDEYDEIIGYAPGYTFEHTLENLEDGVHQIRVEAESLGGRTFNITRRFFVDTTKPELNINVLERETYLNTVELEISMMDNFPMLQLFVFDSEEFNYDGFDTYLSFEPANETITVSVDLEMGQNLIPIKLVDAAGNEFTTEIEVERSAPSDEDVVRLDKEALEIVFAKGDNAENVTQDLILPTVGEYGSFITWASSNEDVIANDGKVTRPLEDTTVTLTATLASGNVTDTKEFTVKVIAREPVDKSELQAKIEECETYEERYYTEESWTALQDALTAARAVLKDEYATEEAVDNALQGLIAAIEGLEEESPITRITGKYGAIEDEDKAVYVAYILFDLRDGFNDEDISVLVNNKEYFEKKEGQEDYAFRFEGMIEEEPAEVKIIIGDWEYDVTAELVWEELDQQTLIEMLDELQDK